MRSSCFRFWICLWNCSSLHGHCLLPGSWKTVSSGFFSLTDQILRHLSLSPGAFVPPQRLLLPASADPLSIPCSFPCWFLGFFSLVVATPAHMCYSVPFLLWLLGVSHVFSPGLLSSFYLLVGYLLQARLHIQWELGPLTVLTLELWFPVQFLYITDSQQDVHDYLFECVFLLHSKYF